MAQKQNTLKGPEGEISYDITGELQYSYPCYEENGKTIKIGQGWISHAILEQLKRSPSLRSASGKVVSSVLGKSVKSAPAIMYEIIQGAGYWLECPPRGKGDVKYICSEIKVAYQLYVDTLKNRIYVAEIQEGTVTELKFVHIGKKLFEYKPENEIYENPVSSGSIDCRDIPPPPPPLEKKEPPLAQLVASETRGEAPLTVRFDGSGSRDRDEEGKSIVAYSWNMGSRGSSDSIAFTHTFDTEGKYRVSLKVTDNEGDTDETAVDIVVLAKQEPCYTMVYTMSKCDEGIDTLDQSTIQVPCNAIPPEPKIVWIPCCCDKDPIVIEPAADTSGFQLAGGPIFIQNDGQLLEYALGLDIQIRYPFKKSPAWQFLMDGTYFPRRVANPLDDRPHLWSELRDDIDPITGTLPLHWRRGTRRATASFAIGLDYKPRKRILLKGLYFQGMFGLERTFNQIEASDPLKDPQNQFIGFDLDVFYIESRIGLRKKQLEVYLGGRFLEESRPFTLILANPLGGSHHRSFDNTIHAGISIWY